MKAALILAAGLALAAAGVSHAAETTLHPVKDAAPDIAGAIFDRPDAVEHSRNGHTTTDVVTFTSKDGFYQSGMYRSDPSHFEVKGPKGYGDNEFMYFLKGGVTLTSSDGTVTRVGPGEAVTIPKGWTGTWDSPAYVKFYVTYDPDTKH